MIITLLTNVLALLVTLGILVTVHEFGHFWVARRCGVKVLRFSVGFGKAVKTWIGKDGVEYVIAPIPLGGYVKMLGQEDTSVADPDDVPTHERHQSFAFKPAWQRMAISAAGPLANFILAAFVFWVINISYGTSGIAPIVSHVLDESPAYNAGLRPGDEIVAVDGVDTIIWQQVGMQMLGRFGETGELNLTVQSAQNTASRELIIPIRAWMKAQTEPNPLAELGILRQERPALIDRLVPGARAEQGGLLPGDEIAFVGDQEIRGWNHWVEIIRANPEQDLAVTVKRNGGTSSLVLTPAAAQAEDSSVVGSIGAYVVETPLTELLPADMFREVNYGVVSAIGPALQETWDKSVFVLDSIKKMVVGLISVKNINGPITIAQVAGETASYGLNVYLGFLAILSISLGVLNLLPIPVLDGGHILYCLIEMVTRRPVPERIQAWGLQLGLILISGIMVLAIYNDVARLM